MIPVCINCRPYHSQAPTDGLSQWGAGTMKYSGERVDYVPIIYSFPGLSLVSSGVP